MTDLDQVETTQYESFYNKSFLCEEICFYLQRHVTIIGDEIERQIRDSQRKPCNIFSQCYDVMILEYDFLVSL